MQLPRFYAGWFLIVFFVLFLFCFGMVIWYETGHITDDGFLDTSFAIAGRITPIGVGLALVLYMATEGIQMLAEIFRRQRAERLRREARVQLVDELERDMEGVTTLEEAKELIRRARESADAERRKRNGTR